MADLLWYRSLYWRIAVGFVSVLATVLVIQGFVFAWMTGRMTDIFPSRSPEQMATAISSDVNEALTDPVVEDLAAFITSRHPSSFRGWVVALTDGRVVRSPRIPPDPDLVRAARSRLFSRDSGRGRGRDRGRDERGDGRAGGESPGGEDVAGTVGGLESGADLDRRAGMLFARIVVEGDLMGVVAVSTRPPPLLVTLRDLGPTLAAVALGLLAAGTAVAAFVIGRPTRRRLQQLQDAARALGAGKPDVRAPESGGDEVTALSRAFNEMAGQLDSRTRALARADRTRRQLLADVSHELMTPLSAIRGYVETLGMEDLDLDDEARHRYLSIVSDEATRLEHIIGDLLDLARLEGGGGVFRVEDVDVDQLLERLRHRHEPTLADRSVTLTTASHPDRPVVLGDANRLEQALQNLVANAIRHTPRGGTVDVSVSPVEGGTVFAVQDSGSGIPPEQLPYVFDRFYKVDESRAGTDVPSGSGLGLSIVQAIVQRHGGTVTAGNVAGGGARFEIRLPLGRQAVAQ